MILVNKSPAEDHLLFWMTTYGMIFTVMIAAVSLLVVLFVLQFKNKVNCVLSFMVVAALIIRFFNELFAITNIGAMEGEPLDYFMWHGYSKNLFYGGHIQIIAFICLLVLIARLFIHWKKGKKIPKP